MEMKYFEYAQKLMDALIAEYNTNDFRWVQDVIYNQMTGEKVYFEALCDANLEIDFVVRHWQELVLKD